MRANPRANTKPELRVRSALHTLGHRFRKNLAVEAVGVRVRPDIVFPRCQVAVFIDGCFWHSCPEHGNVPRANSHYWRPKLERNIARDQHVNEALRAAGWRVIRVWEHTPLDDVVSEIVGALQVE